MIDFNRNNLDLSSSPYLRQHADNPVYWQEWKPEVLDYARQEQKSILVSVGYATCHWCHVMAREAFSDSTVAQLLNDDFVAIKVDREQRPDIDQFMMSFLVNQSGSGGWPLNVFLTPDQKPFFALTYAPVQSRYGMPGFAELLEQVRAFSSCGDFPDWSPERLTPRHTDQSKLLQGLQIGYDPQYGGFGPQHKFPPHSTLLFMLHYYAENPDDKLESMVRKTLDEMALGGLHDHLQGGFYRYCTDRQWRIPHFEKMLYDQVMLLWTYSMAARVFASNRYRDIAKGIIKCLEESYQQDGLFLSAHDADTNHEEGGTYVWSYQDLKETLSSAEFKVVSQAYKIRPEGNFEGKYHLMREDWPCKVKDQAILKQAEQKLLAARRKRPQPFKDQKVVTAWNALAGVALIQAYRYLEDCNLMTDAWELYQNLMARHFEHGKLIRSSIVTDAGLRKNETEYLEDYAAVLLLVTFLEEEGYPVEEDRKALTERVLDYKSDKGWLSAKNHDFLEMPAETFDHPTPSPGALAELALTRARIFAGTIEFDDLDFHTPLQEDFWNVSILLRRGQFHLIHSPEPLAWQSVPINTIQKKDKVSLDCYGGVCKQLDQKLA